MSLQAGTRLGPYEVLNSLGAGGMGEVYRATDTNLKRQVAIKVLPASLSSDPERLARFQREAEVLASLNHPHIAQIYGLEKSDRTTALVMELIEGEDLSQRIARGAIPLDEALPIAKQIAEALEAAHEQGIIHRDLKPANIKVRDDGTVKVLDFGLAKLAETPASHSTSDLSLSPTITSPALMTGMGVLLGTAAYMSPEQAKGRPADKRSDIWAFGCVLYEMLTGKRVFEGDDVSEVFASVLAREPDWNALPQALPPALGTLLRRCLAKDRRQRVADISTALFVIEGGGGFSSANGTGSAMPQVAKSRWRRLAPMAGVALAVGAITGGSVWFATRPVPAQVSRLTITFDPTNALTIQGADRDLTITPDGSRVVYVGNRGTQLFVRPLNSLEPVAVFTGTPSAPFVSPDGQWIGFVDSRSLLKRVAVTGGPAITLATLDSPPRGATWTPDNRIIFATNNLTTGLQQVGAAGGPTTILTRPNGKEREADHLWPEVVPGGRAVLFTITGQGSIDDARIAVLDFRTGKSTVIVHGGSHAQYVPSGHLIYAAAGTLRAVPFDLATLTTHGTAVPVIGELATGRTGAAEAVVASDGTLVYVPGSLDALTPQSLTWVDREGHEESTGAPPRGYGMVRLSPDGTRAVADIRNGAPGSVGDLWMWDFARGTLTRLTFGSATNGNPLWTPDGRRIVFATRGPLQEIFWTAADGTGTPERLLPEVPGVPKAMVPDGQSVIVISTNPNGGTTDLLRVFLNGPRHAEPLIATPTIETNADVSADGHWIAYQSDESGIFEIYVRPFPAVNQGRWQISSGGGAWPVWARNGRELFYTDQDGFLVSVAVSMVPTFSVGRSTKLFETGDVATNGPRSYDISSDGQRFLMIRRGSLGDRDRAQVVVVQHFDQELKRLVPAK